MCDFTALDGQWPLKLLGTVVFRDIEHTQLTALFFPLSFILCLIKRLNLDSGPENQTYFIFLCWHLTHTHSQREREISPEHLDWLKSVTCIFSCKVAFYLSQFKGKFAERSMCSCSFVHHFWVTYTFDSVASLQNHGDASIVRISCFSVFSIITNVISTVSVGQT